MPSTSRLRHPTCASGSICLGSVARYLGLLARTLGEFEAAEAHFQLALERNRILRSKPWVAHTQYDYAALLLERGAAGDFEKAGELAAQALATARDLGMKRLEEKLLALGLAPDRRNSSTISPSPAGHSVFRQEGDFWSVTFAGETLRLKDTKGLAYLALLLRNPGKEFTARELVHAGAGPDEGSLPTGSAGDAGEVFDDRATSEYRRRIADLKSELEEAQSFNDLGRAAAICEELHQLGRELSSGIGLGGRKRRAKSDAERARLNVTRAVHAALKHIQRRHRTLGQHLATTVKTGFFCSYNPDPRLPIVWEG